MMGVLSGGSCRATRLRLRRSRLHRAPSRTTAHPPERHDQRGVRWEPFIRCAIPTSASTSTRALDADQGGYPQAPAGLLFPVMKGYGRGTTNSKMAQFAPRLRRIWTPGGDGNTSIRAAGVGSSTRRTVLQHALCEQPAMGRADYAVESRRRLGRSLLGVSGRQSLPGAQHRVGNAAVPGLRRVCECADGYHAHGAAAVEHQRATAVRRLDAVDDLPRQQVDALVASDGAQPRGLCSGRDDRQYQPAPPVDPAGSGAGAVLRHDRTRR